jgi:LPXTG-motif cell wall-anchored protein
LEKIMRNNENTPTRSWKGVTRRLIVAGTSALMVASLMTPSAAFAAESLEIEGNNYYWSEAPEGGYSGSGSEGGTWAWSSADNLELNNYSGSGIEADGDLTVTYEGANNVGSMDRYGITTWSSDEQDGNLTLSASGDATLNVEGKTPISTGGDTTIEGGTVTTKSDNGYGIASSGSVTINNSELKIESTGGNYAMGIYSGDESDGCGGVVINNSTVDIVASSVNGAAIGINADLSSESPAGVAIKDSTVNIKATGLIGGAGIYVSNYGEAYININNSDVSAKVESTSDKTELLAALYAESDKGAYISVDGAKIKTPENGEAFTIEDGTVASIGAKGASSYKDMASEVVIEAAKDEAKDETEPEDEAEVTPASYSKGGEKKLAQTGDASAAGMFAAAAAGVTALGAGAFLSRRRG